MITAKKWLIKFFSSIVRFISKSLIKEVQEKHGEELAEEYQKKETKLKTDWYKCGKCKKLIEIKIMKFKFSKISGWLTKCPYCKNEIYKVSNTPKDLEYKKSEGKALDNSHRSLVKKNDSL